MFVVSNQEGDDFMSNPEVREEYEYIMVVSEMAHFMVKYGMSKIIEDISLCASTLMNPRNFGPDQE